GAARPEDILQVRLEVERALEQSQAVSQLHHRLVRLHSNIWIQLLPPPLKILQVIAKMAVDNAQADHVDRTRGKDAARNKSSREKIGHLADRLVGRDQERTGNTKTTITSLLSEPNENLIKQGVESPVSALKFASIEVAEATVVVPKAGFVIAEQAAVARKAVGLIRNLRNCEQRSIHREIHAVVTVVADGRVAVVDAPHDVGPRGRSYFDKSSPGVIGIGRHTRGVEENAYRIAIEAILHEDVVVGRD